VLIAFGRPKVRVQARDYRTLAAPIAFRLWSFSVLKVVYRLVLPSMLSHIFLEMLNVFGRIRQLRKIIIDAAPLTTLDQFKAYSYAKS
jgi:hypothetical protein